MPATSSGEVSQVKISDGTFYDIKDSAARTSIASLSPRIPPASSAQTDEGKVLRIVNGVMTWVSLPSASGVSF